MSNWKSKILQFGKYTWSEITAMVADGYIPVANATELDGIRNTTPKVMGVGSIWAGTYTTGLDKKYVQINNIDLSVFSNFMPLGLGTSGMPTNFSGIYDGNSLTISNMSFQRPRVTGETYGYRGLFCIIQNATLLNINLKNVNITDSGNNIDVGALVGLVNSNSTVANCIVNSAVIYGHQKVGGMIAGIEGYGASNTITVTNNQVLNVELYRSNSTAGSYQGGLIGGIIKDGTTMTATINVSKCMTFNAKTFDGSNCGGFIGYTQIGYGRLNINDCYAMNSTIISTSIAGGFIGRSITANTFITNCYSQTNPLTGTVLGGFCGRRDAGVFTNCYYDKDTSFQSDTGKGLPRTTVQMKEGTADSIIGGEAMYTGWNNIWNFRTLLKYPKIRKI